jgi:hypothetical protein
VTTVKPVFTMRWVAADRMPIIDIGRSIRRACARFPHAATPSYNRQADTSSTNARALATQVFRIARTPNDSRVHVCSITSTRDGERSIHEESRRVMRRLSSIFA